MPKALIVEDGFNWGGSQRPNHPWNNTFIYEAHVRGVSMQRDDLRPNVRGSFAALADRRFVDHLHKLGVTAIELLPVHAFLQDRFLVERGLRNYWGYSTLSYFAPEPGYLSTNALNEIRMAVRRLHAAGIEVILDVVYNHTCEGNQLGPTFCWRGLDNASYYRLVPGEERYYLDYTGCGNTLNLSHPRVLQMVMDSLRYWAEAYQVDGFRFDLGVSLGREGNGFDPGSGFFDAMRQDPLLSRLKIISEPWDLGPEGYQVGNHPPGFSEWNDKFREATRRFWKGDGNQRGELATRLNGSPDLFDGRHRRPWSSINFVCAHDGFTLHDVVSYNERHNDANGEENRDGHSDNASYNWGVEGDTDDPDILETRERVKRAMLATLLLAAGTPMLLAGDEFGNSQNGNNNAYCQDNPLSWLNWRDAETPRGQQLIRFTERLAALRREHLSLRGSRYLAADTPVAPEMNLVAWFDYDGAPMEQPHWEDPEGRTLMLRRAVRDADDNVDLTLVAVNGTDAAVNFQLPPGLGPWQALLNSGEPDALPRVSRKGTATIGARSVVLFAPDPSPDENEQDEEESQADAAASAEAATVEAIADAAADAAIVESTAETVLDQADAEFKPSHDTTTPEHEPHSATLPEPNPDNANPPDTANPDTIISDPAQESPPPQPEPAPHNTPTPHGDDPEQPS